MQALRHSGEKVSGSAQAENSSCGLVFLQIENQLIFARHLPKNVGFGGEVLANHTHTLALHTFGGLNVVCFAAHPISDSMRQRN